MNCRRSVTNRVLAMLLSLVLCMSLLPQAVFAAGSTPACVTGYTDDTAYTVKTGQLLTVYLDTLFKDSSGHTLQYTMDGGDYGTQTKLTQKDGRDILSFTNAAAGRYTPTITATCTDGVSASVTLNITVEEGASGDASQYGYDETPADSVKVYVTVSSDGIPLVGSDGTVLSHLEVDVPYFDLDYQGLSEFYRYETENGAGSYINDTIVRRPTALHLYLYLLGVYYLGCTPEEIVDGSVIVPGHDGGLGVQDMLGNTPYDDTMLALNITGSPTSLYMQQFWGHDENLMYYRNHVYPLMGPGWGSTADYILLSDGDTIDVAMFSNWQFWTVGAFAAFDQDEYTVAKGGELTFQTVKYDTRSVADGGTEEFEPITDLDVRVYDADWQEVDTLTPVTDGENSYCYTFQQEGTYYLMATDPNAGTADSCYAPATAKVTVGGGEKPFDPAEYYKNFDFSSISLDEAGTDYLYHIAESTMYVEQFSNPGDKKVYTVTVPAGTETVYVTYPADFDQNILEYCALFDENGTVSWEYYAGSDYQYTVTENDDGSHTIALPAAFLMEKGLYIAAESEDNYEYFNCFQFVEGDNTKPGETVRVAVTGVSLDKQALTVDRRNTAQLTAAVVPENATETRVIWSSNNPSVAQVDKNGLVAGVSEGEAVIRATTKDGGFTADCVVTVTDVNKPAVADDGYYEIATGAQLKWFADEVNSGKNQLNARLVEDIDLTGICGVGNPWTPIGNHADDRDYRGIFDGQEHKITGLYLKYTDSNITDVQSYYTALFGVCDGATVKNLSVYGEAKSISRYVAGIVGRACDVSSHRTTLIENCHNYVNMTGSATNNQIFGYAGVVAAAQNAVIRGCSNHAEIQGYQGYTGGIVGIADNGTTTIEKCWNTGAVSLRGWAANFRGVGGIIGSARRQVTITDCYNTGDISFYYKTQRIQQFAGGIVGSVGYTYSSHEITLTNCYHTGSISGEYDDNASMGALVGGVMSNDKITLTANNCWYLDSAAAASGVTSGASAFTAAEGLDAAKLGDAYVDSCPAPVLKGQTAAAHTDADGNSVCDVCGKEMIPVPTRKEGYPAETTATVKTGMAYLLGDLQAGKVFQPVDGKTLSYTDYYYQRSTDGGKTWGDMQSFTGAIFGMTTIQVTETAAGVYTYRFFASHDGKHFSEDTWTLTLHVEDEPAMNFTFYVGQDYTGGYPVIKLYEVETDDEGNEALGQEIEDCFLYSDFTGSLPEGETDYDPAAGQLVGSYQTFYAALRAGRYAYRAFARNADTGDYDVALGGMVLDLPTDTNVDGGAGGGTKLYLQCNSFYVTSKKSDGSYFTADEYHVRVDCPIMKTSCVMGDPYVKGSYTYYPTVLYAAGNACLYNSYAYPDVDGYIFTQNINQTFVAGAAAGSKSMTINTAQTLTVTVPADATFGLYFQWNNFNTTEVEPDGDADIPAADRWTFHEDGTKTAVYAVSKGSSNYTWRLSDDTHVTQAGWLSAINAATEKTFTFGADAATNRMSHDFSRLGTQTIKRDEADLQVNLDPSGFEAPDGTTRIRAYRHWQLINSDAGNIMVEPDFHWDVKSGDAEIETVNGGNTSANWADVTPGTEDSVITVYYDSVDVNPGDYSSHGGLYPATSPARVGVVVVGGTEVTHGTADADVDFNMAADTTTTRSMDWDYNYDTWYYEAKETDPALTFAVVKNTGSVTVDYAFVTTTDAMVSTVSDFRTVAAGADGRYSVPLSDFNELGNRMGGTVILRMTDETGVSYRLVRVAKVTVSAENASHLGEDIMPGDQVKLTFTGMYRGVNKVSGIFNPTIFKPTYWAGESKYDGTLAQYQKMDNASVTVTVPENINFAEGEDTATYTFTNGYTYGSMYSAANPFAFLYNMTDTGVGTNFNAVTVNYYMNHYADAVVTVHRKVLYDVALTAADQNGTALADVGMILTDSTGKSIQANENGRFTLGYGEYAYTLSKSGYVTTYGSFSLGSADASKVQDGILSIGVVMQAAGDNAWDGTAAVEPAKDENDIYLIGTAAELAWFAKNGGTADARLTADIELAGFAWTPLSKYYGTFDGQGHVVRNLYINSAAYPVGLFGYLQSGAAVKNLGVTGSVTCTAKSNAQAGGIAGYMNGGSSITGCWSAVDVTTAKHGGGIAGYTANSAVITDCYATGTIRTSSTNECYLGGICASGYSNTIGATLTNCYSTAKVIGSSGTASYVGALSPDKTAAHYVNCYMLEDTVSGASAKYGITGLGTAKTAAELKVLAPVLGSSFADDAKGINGGYPILTWQVVEDPLPLGDVNGDGVVDDLDAAMVYAFANARITATARQKTAADVNGDGAVTAQDAEIIYSFYLGEIVSLTANN